MITNLDHLLDPDPNTIPEMPPPPPSLDRLIVDAGEGLRVSQIGDDILISAQDEEQDAPVTIAADQGDPLAYMSYRAKLVQVGENRFVTVQTSYLNNVYYESGWYHESFEISSETLAISVFPQYLYLKMPVRFFSGLDLPPSTDIPNSDFTSEPQTINGSPYFFRLLATTGYVTRNRNVTPANFFVLSEIPLNDNTLSPIAGSSDFSGFWHFLLATVTTGGVQQIHLGALTLPQPLTFNFATLEVT